MYVSAQKKVYVVSDFLGSTDFVINPKEDYVYKIVSVQ